MKVIARRARPALFALSVACALAIGTTAALAGTTAASVCPAGSPGVCTSLDACRSLCVSRGYPAEGSSCLNTGNRVCCFCAV